MRTILIVDDEPGLRRLIRHTLHDPEWRLIEAVDGPSGLKRVSEDSPDLVLLDWIMPGLSGIQVLREIRRHAEHESLPIVMFTAIEGAEDRAQVEQLGVSGYLVKPFSPLELLALVRRILESAPARGPVAQSTRSNAEASSDPGEPRALQPLPGLFSAPSSPFADSPAAVGEKVDFDQHLATLRHVEAEFLALAAQHSAVRRWTDDGASGAGPLAPRLEDVELIRCVRSGYERLTGLVERCLTYLDWRIGDPADQAATTDLAEFLARAARRGDDRERTRPAPRVSISGAPCRVRGRGQHFETLFDCLLEVAGRGPGEGAIAVALDGGSERVSFAVTALDGSLPEGFEAQMLQPFSEADVERLASKNSLHLALAHSIVEAYGGSLRLEALDRGWRAVGLLPALEPSTQSAAASGSR